MKALLRQGVPTHPSQTTTGRKRDTQIEQERASGQLAVAAAMHADDLSSDDEAGTFNHPPTHPPTHPCPE